MSLDRDQVAELLGRTIEHLEASIAQIETQRALVMDWHPDEAGSQRFGTVIRSIERTTYDLMLDIETSLR